MVDPVAFPKSFGRGKKSGEAMRWRMEAWGGNGVVNRGLARFVAGGGGVEEKDEILGTFFLHLV